MKELCKSKPCFKCTVEKPIEQFYKHAKMGDGHLGKCKECTRADVAGRILFMKSVDPDFDGREKIRGREKYHKYKYKNKDKGKSNKKHLEKYPEKKKALALAVIPPAGFNNHHWSYNDEHLKDIITIPKNIHYKLHRYIIYVPNLKIYKTLEGTMLDTKEKHIQYMEIIKTIF